MKFVPRLARVRPIRVQQIRQHEDELPRRDGGLHFVAMPVKPRSFDQINLTYHEASQNTHGMACQAAAAANVPASETRASLELISPMDASPVDLIRRLDGECIPKYT
jgi:hypothetical protein